MSPLDLPRRSPPLDPRCQLADVVHHDQGCGDSRYSSRVRPRSHIHTRTLGVRGGTSAPLRLTHHAGDRGELQSLYAQSCKTSQLGTDKTHIRGGRALAASHRKLWNLESENREFTLAKPLLAGRTYLLIGGFVPHRRRPKTAIPST